MKKIFYSKTYKDATIECFKLLDVDELTDNAYEIKVSNSTTKETDSVTTNSPQGAIALADLMFSELSI